MCVKYSTTHSLTDFHLSLSPKIALINRKAAVSTYKLETNVSASGYVLSLMPVRKFHLKASF